MSRNSKNDVPDLQNRCPRTPKAMSRNSKTDALKLAKLMSRNPKTDALELATLVAQDSETHRVKARARAPRYPNGQDLTTQAPNPNLQRQVSDRLPISCYPTGRPALTYALKSHGHSSPLAWQVWNQENYLNLPRRDPGRKILHPL